MGTISGMNLKVKYVIRDVDRYGLVRWYYRAPGCKKVRLPSPNDPSFFAELSAAKLAAQPGEALVVGEEGSLRWLCSAYMDSATYRQLSADTRRVRKRLLDALCQKHGEKPFKAIDPQFIMGLRDKKADTPEAANHILKSLRGVFEWAKEARHVRFNPAKEVSKLESNNPEGWHTWTEAELDLFRRRHPIGTKAYLALALLQYSMVRRSDVVRLGKQMVRDGNIHFVEWKGRGKKRTRKERVIPVLPQLQDALDLSPVGDLTFLVNELNTPFASGSFGNWFKDRCVEAALPHCSAHGVRKAAATIAAENGATGPELMAMGGWAKLQQVDGYIRKVNTTKLAQSAMHKVVPLKSQLDKKKG